MQDVSFATMGIAKAFWSLVVLWSLAIVVKAVKALRRGDGTYRFSIWDGGLMKEGKLLGRRGTQVKLAFASLVAATGTALLGGLAPIQSATYFVVALLIAGIVADQIGTIKGIE